MFTEGIKQHIKPFYPPKLRQNTQEGRWRGREDQKGIRGEVMR
jgi:hypothetical protein